MLKQVMTGFLLGASVAMFCIFSMTRIVNIYAKDISECQVQKATIYIRCLDALDKLKEEYSK